MHVLRMGPRSTAMRKIVCEIENMFVSGEEQTD